MIFMNCKELNKSYYGDFLFVAFFTSVLNENGLGVEYFLSAKYEIDDFSQNI